VLSHQHLVCRLLDLLVCEQNWQDQNYLRFDPRVWLSLLFCRDKIEVVINLVVIAKLVGSLESLKTCVHSIKDDLMFSDEVLNDKQECALADGGVQDDLEVFHELFESLDGPVSQNELHMVIFQVFFLHLSNHSFKVDYHNHLISVGFPSTEVQSPTFELVYFVCGWLQALRVINDAEESLRAIFFLLWVL